MKAKLHLVFSITIFFSCFCIYGQQGYWKGIPKQSNLRSASLKDISEAKKVLSLDKEGFSKEMRSFATAKMKGKIVDVVEKGFKLGDRIIRHPKVVVGN